MRETRNGILAGGNWIVDYVKTIDAYPEEDNLANILGETVCNGGSPYNLLTDLAALGAHFPLEGIGMVGEDEAAELIRSNCKRSGIDAKRLVSTDKAPTSYTVVMATKGSGRRTFFHHPGANALLSERNFDFSTSNAKLFHLGYLMLLERLDEAHADGTVAAHLLKKAQQHGFVTSIDVVSADPSRFEPVVIPALRFADYCFMNEIEAERATGIPLRLEGKLLWSHLHRAAHVLLEHGVKQWVLIHFPEGAFAVGTKGAPIIQGSVQMPRNRIKCVVGSGDAFAAGVLFGVHEGKSMAECLEYGVSAAAACITDHTTSGGLLPLQECLALAKRYGFSGVPELAI